MPRLARKSNLAIVHPASESRIERAAAELTALRTKISELEKDKAAKSAQLLKMVQAEGEPDDKGKIRYTTDAHNFIVIGGKNVHTDGSKAIQALVKAGVKVAVAKKAIAASTKIVEYEYIGVYPIKTEKPDA